LCEGKGRIPTVDGISIAANEVPIIECCERLSAPHRGKTREGRKEGSKEGASPTRRININTRAGIHRKG
jgi:hypothetical protein